MGRKVLTHEHISSHPRWQLHTCVHLFWADAKRCCLVLLFCPPNKCVAQFSQYHAPDSRAVIRRNTEHQSASRFRVAASRNAPRTSGCIGTSQDLHALPGPVCASRQDYTSPTYWTDERDDKIMRAQQIRNHAICLLTLRRHVSHGSEITAKLTQVSRAPKNPQAVTHTHFQHTPSLRRTFLRHHDLRRDKGA
jgi:hypothetical protein